MRLGLLDGNPKRGIYGNLGPHEVCSKEHQNLAFEAAGNGIVLLKNSLNLLPLSRTKTPSLAVIDPNAQTTGTLLGNYEGVACKNITIFQALKNYVNNTCYHQGCLDSANCTSIAIDEAVGIAKSVDYVILVMGLDQSQEREKFDRIELVLPGKQEDLVLAVARAANKPVLLVLLGGGPVDVSLAKDDAKIGSILWAGYPGQAGGTALAEIIFGDHNSGTDSSQRSQSNTQLKHSQSSAMKWHFEKTDVLKQVSGGKNSITRKPADSSSSKPRNQSNKQQNLEKTDDQNTEKVVNAIRVLKRDHVIMKPARKDTFSYSKAAGKDSVTEMARLERTPIMPGTRKDASTAQKLANDRVTYNDLFQEMEKLENVIQKLMER